MPALPPDMSLWDFVCATVSPLGRPFRRSSAVEADRLSDFLDLHGLTLDQAFDKVRDFLAAHRRAKSRSCLIVTGKSGQIRYEFPFWMENSPSVRRLSEENGGGAWRVYLRDTI